MTTETEPRKQLKRIRVQLPEESPARRAGLVRIQAEREGFSCACGTHQAFSNYIMAHWSSMHQHTCKACGRVHKLKDGVVIELSGPTKKLSKIKHEAPEMVDPNKPLWRAYHRFNNGARPVTYGVASDYHDSIDAANAQAFDYAGRVHPNSRERRDDLFRSLIRQEEFPLLSTVQVDGKIVGGGHLQSVGRRMDGARQSEVIFFEFADPKGRVTRIDLLPEVWKEIAVDLEYEPKRPTSIGDAIRKGRAKEMP